jgi:hypothetical protein
LRFKVALLPFSIFSVIGLQLVNPQNIRYFLDTAAATGDTQPYTNPGFRSLREITAEIQNLQSAAAGLERVESLAQLQSKVVDNGDRLRHFMATPYLRANLQILTCGKSGIILVLL